MKGQTRALIIISFFVLLLVVIVQLITGKQEGINIPSFGPRSPFSTEKEVSPTPSLQLNISIDFSDGKKLSEKVIASSVYEALLTVTKDRGIRVEAKEYKYGVLVEKIGDKGNSRDYAWIYYVNGKIGNIAADRYKTGSKDKIEWRYEKVMQ